MIIHNIVPAQKTLDIFLTIATEFLRKYPDSKAIALKEYYNYSPNSTYTESCRYFQETIVTVKLSICRKQEIDMQ